MRTFKQYVESLCFLLSFCFGLAIFLASPFAFAKDGSAHVGHAGGLQLGQIWPAGDVGTNVDSTIGTGLFYEYQASDVFGLKADWVHSNHDDQLDLDSFTLAIKANLVYYDRLAPFAFFGMGLYGVDKNISPASGNASKTLFGMNFGLGADLDLTESAFVGMYFCVHNLFSGTASTPTGSYELSGRWSGFFLRGGVRF